MGPPPPPSASYLWKFDDDSDNDTADISSDIESANNKMYDDDDNDDDYHYNNDDCKNSSTQSNSTSTSNNKQMLERKDTKAGINHDKSIKLTSTDTKATTTTSASKSSVSSMIIGTTRKNLIASNIYSTKPIRNNNNHNDFESIKSDSPDSTGHIIISATNDCNDNQNRNDNDDHISVESNDNDDLDLDIDHGTVATSTSSPTNSSKQKKKNKKKKHRKKKPILQPVVVVPSDEVMITTSTTTTTTTTNLIPSRNSCKSSLKILNDSKNKQKSRHVSFTTVSIYTFERCFGLCVVPTHGGWPLGMVYKHDDQSHDIDNNSSNDNDNSNTNDDNIVNCCTIDEYEANKYQRLLHRYEQQQQIQSKQQVPVPESSLSSTTTQQKENNNKSSNNNKNKKKKIHRTYGTSSAQNTIDTNTNSDIIKNETSTTTTLLTLETRQWDYKQHKQKNPLFGVLQETDRMNLLLLNSNNTASDKPVTNDNTSNNSSASSSNTTNTRSNTRHAATTSSNDHIHPIYTSAYVNQIRNELEQIRIDRTTGIGCNCRKLLIPTTLSSSSSNNISNGHKKSKHRPMKLQKLKDELIKRNLLPPSVEMDPNVSNGSDNNPTDTTTTANTDNNTNMTREEMEQLLNSVIEKESCCLYADTCFCVRNGIGCQADVCTCWHTSHQSTCTSSSSTSISNRSKSSTIVAPTIQEIQSRCGNTIDGGIYVVDDAKIDTFRDDYLRRLKVCPFITLES